MYVSTRGIVLHTTKYSDHSLIVKIYTLSHGTQSFIIKNAFTKKKNAGAALFTPLALLQITYDDHYLNQLKYLKEVDYANHDLLYADDPAISTIQLFYCELLYKLLFDAGEDQELFLFLEEEIALMYQPNVALNILPLQFLLRLSVRLGFMPQNNYSSTCRFFSLPEGKFLAYCIDETSTMPQEESFLLHQLLSEQKPATNRLTRVNLLHYLVRYYQTHNEHLRNISSLDILSAVLH